VENYTPWETEVEQLYKEMYPALHIYALRVLGESALAEESIQETFCIACAKREQFLSSADPRRWIMCTLKYVCQNMLRTQAKLKKLLLSLEPGKHLAAGTPDLISVDVLFGDLSASEDFRLLKRIALGRCTVLEVAEEMGISVESCKKRVQRARKRLQKKIEASI
jgi:DNA-directed RNA polymerase specialized sigma24 family protein